MKHWEAAAQSLRQGKRIPLKNQQLTRLLVAQRGREEMRKRLGGEVKDGKE